MFIYEEISYKSLAFTKVVVHSFKWKEENVLKDYFDEFNKFSYYRFEDVRILNHWGYDCLRYSYSDKRSR